MKKTTIRNLKIFSLAGFIGLNLFLASHSNAIKLYLKFNPLTEGLFDGTKSEKIIDTFEDSMQTNSFFLEKLSYEDMTEQEDFLEKFSPYINTYGEYLDYGQIKSIKEGLATYEEGSIWDEGIMIDFYNTFYNAISANDFAYSGIYSAYTTSVIKAHFGYGTILNEDKCYKEFESIFDILPRRTVAEYILKNDIPSLLSLLQETYYLDDETLLQELVSLFNEVNSPDFDEENSTSISRIKEIRNILMRSKLSNDPNFAHTIQGTQEQTRLAEINQTSNGNRPDSLTLNYDGTFNVCFRTEKYGSIHLFNIDFCSKDSIISEREVKSMYVEKYLDKSLHAEDDFYKHIWHLLSFIIDFGSQEQLEQNGLVETVNQSLSSYFKTPEEINEFIIGLANGNPLAVNKYFSIFVSKCKNEPDPLKALAESKSLQAYYNSKVFYHHYNDYYIDLDEGFLPTDPKKIDKHSIEAKNLLFIEDYYFGEVDPDPYFAEISEDVAARTTYIYDSDETIYKERDWVTGTKEYRTSYNVDIYSPHVNPTTATDDNNKHYVYYQVPQGLTEFTAVKTFLNLDNEMSEIPVNGLTTTIYNPETGLDETIYVVYCEDSPPETPYEPIQFKTDLFELEELYEKTTPKSTQLTYKLSPTSDENVNKG